MVNEIFTLLTVFESVILWISVLSMINAFRRLSEGDLKNLSFWMILIVAFFSTTISLTMFEGAELPLAILLRRHILALLITICSAKLAYEYSKFVGIYTFGKSATVQKRLEEWIKDY